MGMTFSNRYAILNQAKEVMPMNTTKTGKFIAELRRERGLNQTEFGDIVGATNKTVSRWETGVYFQKGD